ncbi:MAG: hydrogenase expression/formation protein HypC [Pseudomonadota bacterium]|jgi:hydrogenase expression/formation protein HypC|nr:hydrogenase expression/formation protein HypC [Pseudomonadota bacterium]MDQ5881299.1 hydrogenase expression/formation protein HypC [Pseudomonadota bacterium]MDQ5905201.1 hydrogenase expression/formation protein HypC [Pseudomonadota bacterium]MDQ5906116.1 hydrogenase expression/formation protein HypC [Pseudomonadota bacterium]MDQ5946471.1 hydrogenase expression/formation protein HypC [Pseudomonadota bacterium]
MCLSIPMRVVEWVDEEGMLAWVERGEGDSLRREQVNMMLIGAQPVGTWILASLGLAKETVDDENRMLIEDALSALDASLDGNYDATRHFADLK